MMGGRNQGPRRLIPPEELQTRLRQQLMRIYRQDRRYQMITAQDLRPLWRAVWKVHRIHPGPSLPGWIAAYRQETIEGHAEEVLLRDPRVHEYVRALDEMVTKKMRLTVTGEPASWAVESLHGDVSGMLVNDPYLTPYEPQPPHQLTVELEVWLNGATVSLVGDEGVIRSQVIRTADPLGLSFLPDDWSVIEQVAVELVRDAVGEAQSRLKVEAPGHNPSSLERQEHDLHLLVRYLFHKVLDPRVGTPEGKALQQRLRRIAHKIDIDFPAN